MAKFNEICPSTQNGKKKVLQIISRGIRVKQEEEQLTLNGLYEQFQVTLRAKMTLADSQR